MRIRVRIETKGTLHFSSKKLEQAGVGLLMTAMIWTVFQGIAVYGRVTSDAVLERLANVAGNVGVKEITDKMLAAKYLSTSRVRANRCSPLMDEELAMVVDGVTRKYTLDRSLLRAVIETESGGFPCAVSHQGAMGLMQLMPGTARHYGVRNPYDPHSNVDAGARYLKSLLDRYDNNMRLALAAYNAGPGNVDQHKGVPPFRETQRYVRSILSRAARSVEADSSAY